MDTQSQPATRDRPSPSSHSVQLFPTVHCHNVLTYMQQATCQALWGLRFPFSDTWLIINELTDPRHYISESKINSNLFTLLLFFFQLMTGDMCWNIIIFLKNDQGEKPAKCLLWNLRGNICLWHLWNQRETSVWCGNMPKVYEDRHIHIYTLHSNIALRK